MLRDNETVDSAETAICESLLILSGAQFLHIYMKLRDIASALRYSERHYTHAFASIKVSDDCSAQS